MSREGLRQASFLGQAPTVSGFYSWRRDAPEDPENREGYLTIYTEKEREFVSVFFRASYGEKTPQAEVNWSAVGSVPVSAAIGYAALLQAAVLAGEVLNRGGSFEQAAAATGLPPTERHIDYQRRVQDYQRRV